MKQGLYSAIFHDFVNFAKIGLKDIFAVNKCCILVLKKNVFFVKQFLLVYQTVAGGEKIQFGTVRGRQKNKVFGGQLI